MKKNNKYNYLKIKNEMVDFVFIIPCLIFFVVFVIIPLIWGIPLSLTNWNGISPTKEFIGIKNYVNLLHDEQMKVAVANTLKFTFFVIVGCHFIGICTALVIKKSCKFNNFIRMLIFMPFTISLILSSIMWRYMYNDVFYGIMGILSPLIQPKYVIFGISTIAIWRISGYCMVVYIAALQGIPVELYSCAAIEGANRWQTFWKITFPMIMPAVTVNTTLLISWGMKVFDYPMAATGGGPGFSSMTLAMYVYENLFTYFKASYGQAVSIVFASLVFTISALITRLIRKKEVEL